MKVKNGHTVTVHYKGTLPEEDNVEFDSSQRRGQPIEFEVGGGRMLPGFDAAVVGMAQGEIRTISLAANEAYGPSEPAAFQDVPKNSFGEGFDFKLNGMIQGTGPMGPFVARIHEVRNADVTLDFNHPLAGKALNFEIELVSVQNTAIPVANWSASMKKAELLEIAKAQGLKVNTRSTKSQIVEALNTQ
jgi:FKBP-type peptidyl-prolyl cis-trans isomerase 2